MGHIRQLLLPLLPPIPQFRNLRNGEDVFLIPVARRQHNRLKESKYDITGDVFHVLAARRQHHQLNDRKSDITGEVFLVLAARRQHH